MPALSTPRPPPAALIPPLPALTSVRHSSPSVTVVIPVWGRHVALLPRCLRAIANQHVPVDLVVVDNASSQMIPATPHARRVSLSTRCSIGAARNAGLAHVITPYVVFADADDEIAPGFLARGLALLERHQHAIGVIGRSLVDEHGSYTHRGRRPTSLYRAASSLAPPLVPLLWLSSFQASITSTVLRASAVRLAGGFADNDTAEDWQLAARMARRGTFVCIDDPVRIYHRHPCAARLRGGKPTPPAPRQPICDDCLADPIATRLQTAVARSLKRRAR